MAINRVILYLVMSSLLCACLNERIEFPIQEECASPCWGNIEIGMSEIDLLRIIEEQKWLFEAVSEDGKGFYAIPKAFKYYVNISLDDGIINKVVLSLLTDDRFNLSISDLVSRFHTPSYFYIPCCLDFYRQDAFKPYVDVFIPSKGLVIRATASYSRQSHGHYSVCLDSTALISGVTILERGDILQVASIYYSGVQPVSNLHLDGSTSVPLPYPEDREECLMFTTTF